jgi:hypothetical protein
MKFAIVAFVLLTQIAQAADDSVKITSFYFLNSGTERTPAAELCGVLTAPTGKPEMIKVTVDPKSKTPATYNSWTGKDGKFCLVLATYAGTAEAELVQ